MSRLMFDRHPATADPVHQRYYDAPSSGAPAVRSDDHASPRPARTTGTRDTSAPANGAVPQADGEP